MPPPPCSHTVHESGPPAWVVGSLWIDLVVCDKILLINAPEEQWESLAYGSGRSGIYSVSDIPVFLGLILGARQKDKNRKAAHPLRPRVTSRFGAAVGHA